MAPLASCKVAPLASFKGQTFYQDYCCEEQAPYSMKTNLINIALPSNV